MEDIDFDFDIGDIALFEYINQTTNTDGCAFVRVVDVVNIGEKYYLAEIPNTVASYIDLWVPEDINYSPSEGYSLSFLDPLELSPRQTVINEI